LRGPKEATVIGERSKRVESAVEREQKLVGQGVTGKGVRDSRQVIVRRGSLSFGVVAKGLPTLAWFVGSAGTVKWVVGGQDIPLRHPRDPEFARAGKEEWTRLGDVDVVLFQDYKPGITHEVWSEPKIQTVVWLNQGLRGGEKMPNGWSLTSKLLHHDKAGGVTNGTLTVYVAMRYGSERLKWKQPIDCFENTLRQIMDPTQGGRMCEPPVEGEDRTNTAKGLLDWKERRRAKVKCPTVCSKDKWEIRRLCPQELGHAIVEIQYLAPLSSAIALL
jgi:hypothetical protein